MRAEVGTEPVGVESFLEEVKSKLEPVSPKKEDEREGQGQRTRT